MDDLEPATVSNNVRVSMTGKIIGFPKENLTSFHREIIYQNALENGKIPNAVSLLVKHLPLAA